MRALAACAVVLGLIVSPTVTRAGGPGDKDSANKAGATNGDSAANATPAASAPAPAATAEAAAKAAPSSMEVESELRQMRDLLEAQAKQLQEQQQRMNELEEQLKASQPGLIPAAPVATAAPAGAPPSAVGPVGPVTSAVAAPNPQQDLDKRVDTLESKFGKLSDLANGKIKIGATFYGDWAYYTDTGFGPQFLTQTNQDGPGNSGFNSFDITRAYINFLYTPSDAVTLRLTPNVYRQVDISNAVGNGKNSGIASSSNGNLGFRLKYAYVQFNTLFKGSDTLKKGNLRVGQQMNPLVDWEERLYGYRYVNLIPWNYLSLSSTYTGVALNGPIEFNGREYLDYQIGVFNTASFHAIETNDKKQGMVRLTWYPLGTTSDQTGLGVTGFEDYGYNTKTPDAISTPLNRVAVLVHYQTHSKGLLLAGEYDLGRNAFSTGNLFSGAGPADALGLATTPTPFAPFSNLATALLAGTHTRQQGFDFFGHVRLGHTPFSLFGMYEYFQPNTKISGTNPLDFERVVGGISYKYNDHFEFSFDDQNLNYFHTQFTMTPGQIATFSPSLAAANPAGIPNVVPNGTNAFFINLLFNY